jgi:hypothetical protein
LALGMIRRTAKPSEIKTNAMTLRNMLPVSEPRIPPASVPVAGPPAKLYMLMPFYQFFLVCQIVPHRAQTWTYWRNNS